MIFNMKHLRLFEEYWDEDYKKENIR